MLELEAVLKKKIDKTLDTSISMIDSILEDENNFSPHDFPNDLMFINPILIGLKNIRTRLTELVNQHFDNPYDRVKTTLDVTLSYENDLFSNREGSSKAKRYHQFNRLSEQVTAQIGKSFRPDVRIIDFKPTAAFGNLFKMALLRTKEIKLRTKV